LSRIFFGLRPWHFLMNRTIVPRNTTACERVNVRTCERKNVKNLSCYCAIEKYMANRNRKIMALVGLMHRILSFMNDGRPVFIPIAKNVVFQSVPCY